MRPFGELRHSKAAMYTGGNEKFTHRPKPNFHCRLISRLRTYPANHQMTVFPNAHFSTKKSQSMQRNRKTKPTERNKTNSQKPSLKQYKYWIYLDEDFKIPVLNIFKELKEKKGKEVLEIRKTM